MSEYKIDEINWADYHTAYGTAEVIPSLLKRLASSDLQEAKDASHKLWSSLCHQHASISTAALPSYPFLLEILHSASDELAVEILDILWGFAKCSSSDFFGSPQKSSWVRDLRKLMKKDHIYFQELTRSRNEGVREFAMWISEELTKSN